MSTILPGTVIGKRYSVIREINRGGTAVVYEGKNLGDGSIVALKIMSVKDGKALVPIKGFKREIQNAASLQHDNIVKLVDFISDDKQLVIVWELIQGPDLLDLLNEKGGRLAEPLAANYFAQLLRGVNFMHANGLCHRDLKPENCMIERSTDRLKIIDFGLSKHQQSAVTLGVGTPDYLAPEMLGNGGVQTLNERQIGRYDAKAVDVWAMGVLLYLIVTGQYPFEDPTQPQNVVATLQNISAGRMRPLSKRVTSECADLVSKMLTREYQNRITLQGISQHPWFKANNIFFPPEMFDTPTPQPTSPTSPQHEQQQQQNEFYRMTEGSATGSGASTLNGGVCVASEYSPSPDVIQTLGSSLASRIQLVDAVAVKKDVHPSVSDVKQWMQGQPAAINVHVSLVDSPQKVAAEQQQQQQGQQKPHKMSFSFGSYKRQVGSKPTPATPRVLAPPTQIQEFPTADTLAGTSSNVATAAPAALEMSSRKASQGGRDQVLLMSPQQDTMNAAAVGEQVKRMKLGSICKLWWKGS